MRQHILIERAQSYEIPKGDLSPRNCTYQSQSGYWITNDTNEVLMTTNRAPESVTKKCDRETGEDKKGE